MCLALVSSLYFEYPLVHLVRPHYGQVKTAERINEILEGSEFHASEKNNVQDPYSFRCIPQVHGASKDTIRFASKTFKTEINSVTDNPNIFPDELVDCNISSTRPISLSVLPVIASKFTK